MDRKALTLVIILAIIFVGAASVAVVQWVERAELERQKAELDARVREEQKRLEAARVTEQSLRSEMTQQAQQVTQLRKEIEVIKNPPEDKPT